MARIVFDLDGTLIDSARDIAAAANATLAEVGAAPLTVDEARSFVGAGAVVFVERMAAARDLSDPASLVPSFVRHYEHAVHDTVIYPGVEAALAELKAQGHRLGLCTNKPGPPTHAVLAHLGWDTLFETVFTGDSLSVRKPDPAPLLAAFDALGESPAIYVGDSDVDAETGDRAGVPFLLHAPGYRTTPVEKLVHTVAFDDWAEVPGIIEGLAPALK